MRRAGAALAIAISMTWHAAQGQSVGEQILQSLERYRLAVLEWDLEREVSSFTEDGEISEGNEPIVQGRTTIRALLHAQSSAKVVAYELRVAATRVQGSIAIQNGFYEQRIISAQHEARLVKGVFEVQWARQPDGAWLISRLHTDPTG